ncbi:uncharacterized protein si:ch73-303b9.1 [Brienomyrus brachyistius]|uniref:uncharacterized protein si:ch73-303b9.1 n=1 Tax=Brienomyrus brachyistius TaxID=42636 RepID=UPI0020B2CFE1|nr:uncharacterized protein si:ch73-303b9.1 [Brienomyrus brachyistius]
MEKSRAVCDLDLSKSNEASSTDLNRGFLVDKSLSVSASLLDLPPEGQRWHVSCSGVVVEYTEASTSSFTSWTHSPTLLSPSVFPESQIGQSETPKLAIPVGSKSSTPCEGENVKKMMILGGPVEHTSVDQAASQFPWEISLIKPGPINSPCNPESSLLDEPTWSPKYQPASASLFEISSLGCSGISPNVSDGAQRFWKEASVLRSNQASSDRFSEHVTEVWWQKNAANLSPYASKTNWSLST